MTPKTFSDDPKRPAWHLALLFLLASLLLWPLALTGGRPGYIMDSAGYHHGGEKAVAFVAKRFDPAAREAATAGRATGKAKADDGTQGVRSIPYSVMTYILAAPGKSLLALAIGQALLTAIMIVLLLRATGLADDRRASIALAALLGAGTGIALFTTLATPDIFAGLTILGIVMLAVWPDRFRRGERLAIVAITALAIASHSSHVLIAVGMAGLLALLAAWQWRTGMRAGLAGPAWGMVAIAGGIALVMFSALVGFKEMSVAPKRYPFALARSIEDGPARWYLDSHCKTDHYVVCELFPDGFPDRAGYFLWGADGIAARATTAQMNRIRDEELEIVQRATAAYPGDQLQSSINNLRDQILAVGITPALFRDKQLVGDTLADATRPQDLRWQMHVQIGVVLLSLIALLALWLRANRESRVAVGLVLLGILGNDTICAIFAAPDIRYQNRLLWLLPLFAFLLAWQKKHRIC